MAYPLAEPDRQRLAQGLVVYYEEAWVEGVHALFDRMARANMGKVTGYLDQAGDTYASLKKKSNDKFMVTFSAKVRQQANLYFANLPDVAHDALPLATAALEKLAEMIPVPVIASALAKLIGIASGEVESELHTRARVRADEQIGGATGGELRKMFVDDREAQAYLEQALAQYKAIGRYVQTIPPNIATFQDAITFPSSVFKVQKAVSALNVALVQIRDHVESMQSRLEEVRTVYSDYKSRLDTTMPNAVSSVVQGAYQKGVDKGLVRLQAGKPAPVSSPIFMPPPEPGAATQLAAYVTHALALGLYDSMSVPLPATRGRSRHVSGPPPAFAPPPPAAPPAPATGPRFHPRRGGA